jgi:hypothetical protein
MKKSLLLFSLLFAAVISIKAQCTITPGCTPSAGYCSTPAAGSALPPATETTPYSTVIQITVSTSYSIATITDATVTSVSGLPAGLSYSTNPTNGVIAGGSSGCMLIAGTPTAGSAGNYSVTANVSVNTNLGVFPVSAVWTLTVNTLAGITTVSTPALNLVLTPNPAKSEINLTADFNFQKVRVFDALGNMALTHDANNSYKTTIDLTKLNSGIYFLQIIDGNRIVTRKFIKE